MFIPHSAILIDQDEDSYKTRLICKNEVCVTGFELKFLEHLSGEQKESHDFLAC